MTKDQFEVINININTTRKAIERLTPLVQSLIDQVNHLEKAVETLTAKGPKQRYKKFLYQPMKDKPL